MLMTYDASVEGMSKKLFSAELTVHDSAIQTQKEIKRAQFYRFTH